MLLEEFQENLAALPAYAPIEARTTAGDLLSIDDMVYEGGTVVLWMEAETEWASDFYWFIPSVIRRAMVGAGPTDDFQK